MSYTDNNQDDKYSDTHNGWIYGIFLIVIIFCLGFFIDYANGPMYKSETGLGETMQGKKVNMWEREVNKNKSQHNIQKLR